MSEQEIIQKQEAGVKAYDSDSPPSMRLKAGAFADVGTLILTNRRLIYVNKGGSDRALAYVLGGALAARAVEKSVSKAEVDDLLKYEGSYFIPLQEITKVETARKMGSGYLRVNNQTYGQKPSHSYILGSGWSKNEDWVNAINSAIITARLDQAQTTAAYATTQTQTQNTNQVMCPRCGSSVSSDAKFCTSCGSPMPQQTNFVPPPPPPAAATPVCPSCGNPLTYIQQYQRWYCYKEQKYV